MNHPRIPTPEQVQRLNSNFSQLLQSLDTLTCSITPDTPLTLIWHIGWLNGVILPMRDRLLADYEIWSAIQKTASIITGIPNKNLAFGAVVHGACLCHYATEILADIPIPFTIASAEDASSPEN